MVVPLYKESVNIGKQQVDAGSVKIKKVVKTETVNQPVELRHEEIVIERQPASGQGDSSQAFQGQETTIQLTKEMPVIEKQTQQSGQVVVKKSSQSEQQNIQAQVRSEDVDVVKFGNPQNVTIGQNVESAGAAESPSGETSGASAGSQGTITDPSMLKGDASSLQGRSVQLSNLKVRNVMGGLVVLDAGNGQSIYAVPESSANLKAGDTVNVMGTIKSGGSSNLSGDAAQVLSGQSMFIDAQKIEPAGQ